jgi:hypothetical protein
MSGTYLYSSSHLPPPPPPSLNLQVRGTVRSLTNESAVGFLKQLPGAAERLELVEADLLTPGSYDSVRSAFSTILVLDLVPKPSSGLSRSCEVLSMFYRQMSVKRVDRACM